MSQRIKAHIERSIEAKTRILNDAAILEQLETSIQLCVEAIRVGKTVLIIGNGGSAADAQHLATELVCRYRFDRA